MLKMQLNTELSQWFQRPSTLMRVDFVLFYASKSRFKSNNIANVFSWILDL